MKIEVKETDKGYRVTISNEGASSRKRKEETKQLEKLFDILSPNSKITSRGAISFSEKRNLYELFFTIETTE